MGESGPEFQPRGRLTLRYHSVQPLGQRRSRLREGRGEQTGTPIARTQRFRRNLACYLDKLPRDCEGCRKSTERNYDRSEIVEGWLAGFSSDEVYAWRSEEESASSDNLVVHVSEYEDFVLDDDIFCPLPEGTPTGQHCRVLEEQGEPHAPRKKVNLRPDLATKRKTLGDLEPKDAPSQASTRVTSPNRQPSSLARGSSLLGLLGIELDSINICPAEEWALFQHIMRAEKGSGAKNDSSQAKNEGPEAPRRGRPPKSLEARLQVAEASTPRKRGRPRKNAGSAPPAGKPPLADEIIPKRKRGRPPKHLRPEGSVVPFMDDAVSLMSVDNGEDTPKKEENTHSDGTIKRKRGRPRKSPLPDSTSVPYSDNETPKRKRGRPRKYPLPDATAADADKPKRKRGRPRKYPKPEETDRPSSISPLRELMVPDTSKRKRGRPPKAKVTVSMPSSQDVLSGAQTTAKRGRPPKVAAAKQETSASDSHKRKRGRASSALQLGKLPQASDDEGGSRRGRGRPPKVARVDVKVSPASSPMHRHRSPSPPIAMRPSADNNIERFLTA